MTTLPPGVAALIDLALAEDLGAGDVTSESIFAPDERMTASIVAREVLVVAGVAVAEEVFRRLEVNWRAALGDGSRASAGATIAVVEGPVLGILAAERTALNFLQRSCGVATMASRLADAVKGTGARVVDTRKTAPGYRWLQKRAVAAGGMHNHRADLGSGILIKDNHVAAAGSVAAAVSRVRDHAPHSLRIEVEVDTLEQMREAIDAGAEIVLLDNMSPDDVRAAASEAHAREVLVEVSGGVTLETIRSYAEAGADIISVGAVTHSAPAADIGLDV